MTNSPETVDAIKLMIIGSLLAEYGARLIVDGTKQELRMKVNCVINSVKSLERHFIAHPNADSEARASFRRAFNNGETVLLAELNLTCWAIDEIGLEEIIKAVKNAINEPENV